MPPAVQSSRGSQLLSELLAFLVPILLGVYWFVSAAWISMVVRILVLGAGITLGALWLKLPVTRAERSWSLIFLIYLSAHGICALLATDLHRAIVNWVRFVIICSMCAGFARGLRRERVLQAFGWGLAASACITGGLIMTLYLRFAGFVFPTYERARGLKQVVLAGSGVPFNPLAFSCLYSALLAVALISRRLAWLIMAIPAAASLSMTGSRTPLITLALSLLIAAAINLVNRRFQIVTR